MTEATLSAALLRVVRDRMPKAVVIKHSDRRLYGVPDFTVTLRLTSWWETKHANPGVTSNGIQELTMLRLAAAGYARYIIWEEKRDVKRTLIVHPTRLKELEPEAWCTGFNHHWAAEQIRKVHGVE